VTLKKLTINAYKDSGLSQAVGNYSLQINPESYNHNHSVQFTKNDSTDTAGVTTKFYVQDPQKLSFSFYLDSTGVVPGVTDVGAEITNFKTIVYTYNGSIHSPNYLTVVWGSGLQFNCRLTSLDIDYTLFKPDGTPLRAKLTVNFEQYLSPQELVSLSNKSSPDMTHARTVIDGDTLPDMCYRIYGDSKYYIGVAEFNKLSNFRLLRAGTTILFPPLEDA
jgi:nucleoid-associated protein YgaU